MVDNGGIVIPLILNIQVFFGARYFKLAMKTGYICQAWTLGETRGLSPTESVRGYQGKTSAFLGLGDRATFGKHRFLLQVHCLSISESLIKHLFCDFIGIIAISWVCASSIRLNKGNSEFPIC